MISVDIEHIRQIFDPTFFIYVNAEPTIKQPCGGAFKEVPTFLKESPAKWQARKKLALARVIMSVSYMQQCLFW